MNLMKRVTIDLEHLNEFFPPFKRTVIGSNPVVPTIFHRCNDEFCSALAEYSPFNKEK